MENTGVETDVAVLNDAYFVVQPDNGQVALSRWRFSIDALNQLVNGLVIWYCPMALLRSFAAFTSISITDIGEVLVQQPGAPIGELTSAGLLVQQRVNLIS